MFCKSTVRHCKDGQHIQYSLTTWLDLCLNLTPNIWVTCTSTNFPILVPLHINNFLSNNLASYRDILTIEQRVKGRVQSYQLYGIPISTFLSVPFSYHQYFRSYQAFLKNITFDLPVGPWQKCHRSLLTTDTGSPYVLPYLIPIQSIFLAAIFEELWGFLIIWPLTYPFDLAAKVTHQNWL